MFSSGNSIHAFAEFMLLACLCTHTRYTAQPNTLCTNTHFYHEHLSVPLTKMVGYFRARCHQCQDVMHLLTSFKQSNWRARCFEITDYKTMQIVPLWHSADSSPLHTLTHTHTELVLQQPQYTTKWVMTATANQSNPTVAIVCYKTDACHVILEG